MIFKLGMCPFQAGLWLGNFLQLRLRSSLGRRCRPIFCPYHCGPGHDRPGHQPFRPRRADLSRALSIPDRSGQRSHGARSGPLEQQKLRSTLVFDVEGAASRLNSVLLEIDDDAGHGVAGRHYRVSASLYLPVNLDAEEGQDKGSWGARS
jgi:hypothetical protein